MTENTITCTDFYSLEENIIRNFTANNKLDVLAHTLKVRDNALILARKYVIDYEQAKNAALLHDISTLIPVENYLSIAEALDLEIFPQKGKFRHFFVSGFRASSPSKPSTWSTRKF